MAQDIITAKQFDAAAETLLQSKDEFVNEASIKALIGSEHIPAIVNATAIHLALAGPDKLKLGAILTQLLVNGFAIGHIAAHQELDNLGSKLVQ